MSNNQTSETKICVHKFACANVTRKKEHENLEPNLQLVGCATSNQETRPLMYALRTYFLLYSWRLVIDNNFFIRRWTVRHDQDMMLRTPFPIFAITFGLSMLRSKYQLVSFDVSNGARSAKHARLRLETASVMPRVSVGRELLCKLCYALRNKTRVEKCAYWFYHSTVTVFYLINKGKRITKENICP